MVAVGGRAGVPRRTVAPRFALPVHPAQGGQLPPDSGVWNPDPTPRGPSPASPGYVIGGNQGNNDGTWGTDPRSPAISPFPRRVAPVTEGQTDGMTGPPLGYAGGAPRNWNTRLAPAGDPLAHDRQSWWRGGIQGFNDKLMVRDRHAYWDTGNQKTGLEFGPASANPNTYNNPRQQPPAPELRTVNRSVNPQQGSDATRNQDDLSRPYTWLGEQGAGYSPVYGGVPGLYIPYGSRGGIPYPVADPTGGQGGREVVWSGPPHGLHSQTYPDGADTISRYRSVPQMRPVRVDRPANSPQAGQSYSQTVQAQGGPARGANLPVPRPVHHVGRGWGGAQTW